MIQETPDYSALGLLLHDGQCSCVCAFAKRGGNLFEAQEGDEGMELGPFVQDHLGVGNRGPGR